MEEVLIMEFLNQPLGRPSFEKHPGKLEIRIRGRRSETFYRHADDLLKTEMAAEPDAGTILAARQALHTTCQEGEA